LLVGQVTQQALLPEALVSIPVNAKNITATIKKIAFFNIGNSSIF